MIRNCVCEYGSLGDLAPTKFNPDCLVHGKRFTVIVPAQLRMPAASQGELDAILAMIEKSQEDIHGHALSIYYAGFEYPATVTIDPEAAPTVTDLPPAQANREDAR